MIAEVEKACGRGILDSYGIAIIDLNFLKVMNDTYGHEKGDIFIKKVCDIVCEVFNHSPVFRVGGDGFAEILTKKDLESADSLVTRFKKILSGYEKNESLEPWERVSAAIGYAVYEEGVDNSAGDVFERADANMYADKVAQKFRGNK